jgi:predicted HAD superfamily Cof-like phosphohydrolase
MKKLDALNQVKEFHKTFDVPVLKNPEIPSKERCELRISLIQEELNELKEAIENNDMVEVADALCDLQYVLSGTVLEFGLGKKFPKLFDEVQRSNMSKACKSQKEALSTLSAYKKKDGTEGHYKEINGKFIVYRKDDNKVLKSINYSPADLKKIVENESQEV